MTKDERKLVARLLRQLRATTDILEPEFSDTPSFRRWRQSLNAAQRTLNRYDNRGELR